MWVCWRREASWFVGEMPCPDAGNEVEGSENDYGSEA
jgi:hypothetical protein